MFSPELTCDPDSLHQLARLSPLISIPERCLLDLMIILSPNRHTTATHSITHYTTIFDNIAGIDSPFAFSCWTLHHSLWLLLRVGRKLFYQYVCVSWWYDVPSNGLFVWPVPVHLVLDSIISNFYYGLVCNRCAKMFVYQGCMISQCSMDTPKTILSFLALLNQDRASIYDYANRLGPQCLWILRDLVGKSCVKRFVY